MAAREDGRASGHSPRGLLDRLVGLETEYAIRFTPAPGCPARPGHDLIYEVLADEIGRLVRTRQGSRRLQRKQFFTENGGAFNYEALPFALDEGLVEGGTPECRGPAQLLLYQRAQDELLLEALPGAQRRLADIGWPGELGLLKNCRDAEGHVYGAQENYEVEIASGARLWAYRLLLALTAPLVLWAVVATWTLMLALALVMLGLMLAAAILALFVPPLRRALERIQEAPRESGWERRLGRASYVLEVGLWWPALTPFGLLLRTVAFRRVRRTVLPFLVSRPIVSGAGTIVEGDGTGGEDERFMLSEKGPAIVRTMRATPMPVDRAIFDTGNLMKLLTEPMLGKLRPYLSLFRRRQRMQLGLSDSNAAQVAEYLKVATTTLVIDMAEAGLLEDAPRLKDPVAALHTFISDPGLTAAAPLKGGGEITALELQRWYLDRARKVLREAAVTPVPVREVVRLWGEALDGLEADPRGLVGRLDWVTKRYLLEAAGRDGDAATRKKIDLRYHELGQGYLARLERVGEAPRLVTEEAVQEAIAEPPEGTPAFARGRLVRELASSGARATVSWDDVRVGGGFRGELIRLDDYRARREDEPGED